MRKLGVFLGIIGVLTAMCFAVMVTTNTGQAFAAGDPSSLSDAPCNGGSFFGFPTWYKYLPSQSYTDEVTNQPYCQPRIDGINDIWKIVIAVIEMLTRLASLLAIGFIVYGGVTYMISQGNPDKTKQALKTIINSLVGLGIAIVATALITFLAGRF